MFHLFPRRMALRLSALALASLIASPGFAADGVRAMVDGKTGCRVFAPPSVYKALPHMSWSGACRDRLAEGPGTASFAALPGGQASKTLWGNFHAGFFLGDAKASGRIETPGGSAVLVEFPTNAPAEGSYWVVVSLTRDVPLPVCGLGAAEILIEAPHDLASNDDDRIRQMMQRAATFYRQACPGPIAMRFLVVPPQGQQALAEAGFGGVQQAIARAQLATGAPPDRLSNFSNIATGDSDQGRKAAALKAKKTQEIADSRAAWQALSQKNRVTMWTTPRQIMSNPFRYGDRVVAFPGRFNRMEGPNAAYIRDAQGGRIVVTGLGSDVFSEPKDAIFVGRAVGEREVALTSQVTVKAPTVEIVSVQICARRGCTDYLQWMDEEKTPFPWGEDQTKYLRP